MAIRMTSLRRAPHGDWFARRMIPEDVREAYRGASCLPRGAMVFPRRDTGGQAKQEFRDWDAEIASRIERLRAEARGEGLPALTHRQSCPRWSMVRVDGLARTRRSLETLSSGTRWLRSSREHPPPSPTQRPLRLAVTSTAR